METIITALISNKIILTLAVIISIIIVISAIKKLVKVMVVLLAIVILYIGYLVYSDQKVPRTTHQVMEYGAKKIDHMKKAGIKPFKSGR